MRRTGSPLGTHLLVEGLRVRAHVQVRLRRRLVDVLQAVAVRVHDEASVVVEEHAHAVVAQLVTWKGTLNARAVR